MNSVKKSSGVGQNMTDTAAYFAQRTKFSNYEKMLPNVCLDHRFDLGGLLKEPDQ